MKNQYETVFIITPVLSDIQVKETVKKFRDIITENGGEIVNEEDWGLRKLAYPIQKKSTGFYQLFEFAAEPSFAKTWETQFRRDERIIRLLTAREEEINQKLKLKRRTKKWLQIQVKSGI